jgi:hypothetical protein
MLMTYVPRSTSIQAHDFTEDATTAARLSLGLPLHVNAGPCFFRRILLSSSVLSRSRVTSVSTPSKVGLSTMGSISVFHESCYSRSILNGEIGKG